MINYFTNLAGFPTYSPFSSMFFITTVVSRPFESLDSSEVPAFLVETNPSGVSNFTLYVPL